MDRFLPPLYSVRMCEMNPEVITRHLENARLLIDCTYGRSNFDEELKDLKSIFNWYKGEVDFTFHNPVTAYHKSVGKIKDIESKSKIMSEDQVVRFIDSLPEPFQTMAVVQFCLALRIGEVAAITSSAVDFKNRTIRISDVITWVKDVPRFKRGTKTGENATMAMNDEIFLRLQTLDKLRPKGCPFYFHYKNGPMKYNYINTAYNNGLKDAGLTEFSGTHFLRHTMGTLARRKSGLDAAQAILRHTTSRMSEHYAKLDVNDKASQVVIDAGEIFRRGRASVASSADKSLESSGS